MSGANHCLALSSDRKQNISSPSSLLLSVTKETQMLAGEGPGSSTGGQCQGSVASPSLSFPSG